MGSGEKNLLIRAVGPGLLNQGVSNFLEDPSVSFFGPGGPFGGNDDWGESASAGILPEEMARVGAFALDVGSTDSADIVSLTSGVYTAIVANEGAESGITLVEVYNADVDDTKSLLRMCQCVAE